MLFLGEMLPVPGARHNRSRSDIVGSFAQRMINESAGMLADRYFFLVRHI